MPRSILPSSQINPKGVGGFIFTVGILLIVLVGVPQTRWFFVGALALGIVVGIGLHLYNRNREGSDEDAPPHITPPH